MKIIKSVLGLLSISMLAGTVWAAELPKVLIIGDSISKGYAPVVREQLKDVAEVDFPVDNCMHTGNGLKMMKTWLGTNKWDVIHFNFGIWDTQLLSKDGALLNTEIDPPPGARVRFTPEQYRENLTKIVDLLQATGAKLVWASTTPVMARKGKRFEAILKDNEVAAAIMKQHKIPIDDLYAYVLPNAKAWQNTDGCHFGVPGNEQIAKKVAESIQQALSGAKSK
jgi:acyl-CoA thioesterase-1